MNTQRKTTGVGQIDTRMEMKGEKMSYSLPRQFVKRKGTPSLTKQEKDFKAENGKNPVQNL
ncbi:MAG: hypothetical protein AB7T38_10345 [Nitrospirales bacterium]